MLRTNLDPVGLVVDVKDSLLDFVIDFPETSTGCEARERIRSYLHYVGRSGSKYLLHISVSDTNFSEFSHTTFFSLRFPSTQEIRLNQFLETLPDRVLYMVL